MPVINYEPINPSTDITTTRTLLHEAIPLTGSILSGTYKEGGAGSDFFGSNIKNYTHGMFQSCYDYPYLSSSANHILDLTVGYSNNSTLSGSSNTQNAKKINLYTQFAQVLLGFTGSSNDLEIFESDLGLGDNNSQMSECFFVSFSRLLTKDQIKKGSFTLDVMTGSYAAPWGAGGSDIGKYWPLGPNIRLQDMSASTGLNGGTSNTQGGDYGLLYRSGTLGADIAYGVVFYQAGIAVITASVFSGVNDFYSGSAVSGLGAISVDLALTSSAISTSCDAFRHRLNNVTFNNTTEINSTIYFCRVPFNKYNYSSNPTYVSSSQIRVKQVAPDEAVSYITTVGLYNASNQLMAVAKLSEPLKKTPSNELTLRVRLDY